MSGWREDAACRAHNPEWWFPHPSDPTTEGMAVRVCRRCPVMDACRAEALANGETEGIWGGLTARELRAARRFPSRPLPAVPTRRKQCGAGQGYALHRRAGESPCEACRDVERARSAARRSA